MKSNSVWTAVVFLALVSGCGGTTTGNPIIEDTSSSGAAAGAVGGALSGSNQNGTLAFMERPRASTFYARAKSALDFLPGAEAAGSCPIWATSEGSGCHASGSTMWLNYPSCTFGPGITRFSGTQAIVMSTGTASCGTFPYPGASQSLLRQYVAGSGSTTPSTLTIVNGFGTTAYVDDASTNLANFDTGTTIPPLASNNGYGNLVTFNASGARSGITLAHRVAVTGLYDHSIYGNLSISEAGGATQRTVSGSVTVYLNVLRVVGTSTFNNVVHQDGCCLPVSGSVTTTFAQGQHVLPSVLGYRVVGKSETLTFTGCGTASYTAYDGSTTDVSLTHCF